MKTAYYNPNNENLVEIDSSLPPPIKEKQESVAIARGFKKLRDIDLPRTEKDSMFEYHTKKIVEIRGAGGKKEYIRKWKTMTPKVCISEQRFLNYLKRIGRFDVTMRRIRTDIMLSKWMSDDRTYTRGNPESEKIARLLGFTIPTFERMCQSCFEIR